MDDGGSGVVILAFQGEGTLKSSNGVNSTAFLKVKVKVAQSCLTLWDPVACRMPGFRVRHQVQGLAQTHLHQVSDGQGSQACCSPWGLKGSDTTLRLN